MDRRRRKAHGELPVTLSYDNHKGLVFKRKISVDEFYMFTVADTVENTGKEPVTLYPDATETRQGQPKRPATRCCTKVSSA